MLRVLLHAPFLLLACHADKDVNRAELQLGDVNFTVDDVRLNISTPENKLVGVTRENGLLVGSKNIGEVVDELGRRLDAQGDVSAALARIEMTLASLVTAVAALPALTANATVITQVAASGANVDGASLQTISDTLSRLFPPPPSPPPGQPPSPPPICETYTQLDEVGRRPQDTHDMHVTCTGGSCVADLDALGNGLTWYRFGTSAVIQTGNTFPHPDPDWATNVRQGGYGCGSNPMYAASYTPPANYDETSTGDLCKDSFGSGCSWTGTYPYRNYYCNVQVCNPNDAYGSDRHVNAFTARNCGTYTLYQFTNLIGNSRVCMD